MAVWLVLSLVYVKEAHHACCTIGKAGDKAEDYSKNNSIRLKVDDLDVQLAPGDYIVTSTRED